MAVVEKSMLVEYPAKQMFTLVNDVEAYPRFLPWCGGAEVMQHDDKVVHAAITIDFKGIKQRFSTRNQVELPVGGAAGKIAMTLIDGPFHILDGLWVFKPLGDSACKIEFRLHYEFSNKIIEKLVGPVFGRIANSFVDAFVKQAERMNRTPR